MKGDEEASGGDAWGGDQTLDYLTPRDFDPSILKERPQNGAEQITKSKHFYPALGNAKERQQSSARNNKDSSDMTVPPVAETPITNDGIPITSHSNQHGFNPWFRYMPPGHILASKHTFPHGANDSGSIAKAVIAGRSFDTRHPPVLPSTANSHIIAMPTSDDSYTTNGSDYAGMSLVTPSIRNLIYPPDPSMRLNKDTGNGPPPSQAYGYAPLYTQHLPSWLNSPGSTPHFAFGSRLGTSSTPGQDVLDNELFDSKERPQTVPASNNLMPFGSSSSANLPSTFDRRMSFLLYLSHRSALTWTPMPNNSLYSFVHWMPAWSRAPRRRPPPLFSEAVTMGVLSLREPSIPLHGLRTTHFSLLVKARRRLT